MDFTHWIPPEYIRVSGDSVGNLGGIRVPQAMECRSEGLILIFIFPFGLKA